MAKETKKPGTSMTKFNERMAELAKSQTSFERADIVPKISYSDGEFLVGEDSLGEELECVLVDECFVNQYFLTDYDKKNPTPPDCFAIGQGGEENLAPHVNSGQPQAEKCGSCWANAFGTAEKGRGKACGNYRRLTLVAADKLKGKKVQLQEKDLYVISIPPTGLKNWKAYKKALNDMHQRPMQAVTTVLKLEREGKHHLLVPEVGDLLSEAQAMAVLDLMESSRATLMQPYSAKAADDGKKKGPAKVGPAKRPTKTKERKVMSARKAGRPL